MGPKISSRLNARALACAAIALACTSQLAHATNVVLYSSIAGNVNYVAAGGTLRTGPDNTGVCGTTAGADGQVTTSAVNMSVAGIPGSSTTHAAYLYWTGSGTTIHSSGVKFNGTSITADRTFTESFTNGGFTYWWYGGFKDVTSLVSGNGTYSFQDTVLPQTRDISGGAQYCTTGKVLSAFALVVVYNNASEKLRVINVFDGLENFWGSSITLNPANFVIPGTSIDGKFGIITWEGDVANSGTQGGFSEAVSFNGNVLTDAANPAANQFNSTINTYGTGNTYYGLDFDIYDVSPYLTAGNTSATTLYSSGADQVMLGAQIISVTNDPTSDLQITKSHSGSFAVNTNGTYSIVVKNNGPSNTTGTVTVTDTLPTGLTYVSGTGTGWTCGAVGQVVTCTMTNLNSGVTAPTITLTVAVGNAAYPAVTNTASVSGPLFDNILADNTSTDSAAVVTGTDLSSSTKTVVDVNGGESDIGDVLQYTITITNPSTVSSATGVSVTDDMPLHVTNLTVQSIPAGATDSSTGNGTGANSDGYLDITNITIPINSTVTIVYDVTISAGTTPGTNINNTATVTNPAGPGDTPAAPTIVVSPSQIPTTGTKQLYLNNASGTVLSRTRPTGTTATSITNGSNVFFTMTPLTQTSLIWGAGTVSIPIRIARSNATNTSRTIRVDLDTTGGTVSTIGNQSQTVTFGAIGTYQTVTFTVTKAATSTLAVGTAIRLKISNTTGTASRDLTVRPFESSIYSSVNLLANTVINVNSTDNYNAAYPGGSIAPYFDPGNIVHFRTIVSDPFGSFDINSANITIKNPAGTTLVSAAAMTQVADSGTSTKTYEYNYTLAGAAPQGYWNVTVQAKEGVENTISDSRITSFKVGQPAISVTKTSAVVSDPTNGATNPKRIPGSIISYTIGVSNAGHGSPDADSMIITDPLPTTTMMCVSTTCTGGPNPVAFTDGSPTSALTFVYATDVNYSNTVGGGAPFTYTPVPDANGYDAAVTGIQVTPEGTMAATTGTAPSFSLKLFLKVK